MQKQRLTSDLHKSLIEQGYQYFLIKDIVIPSDDDHCWVLTVQAVREMPAVLKYSCTGIQDKMIDTIIRDEVPRFEIYLEAMERVAQL